MTPHRIGGAIPFTKTLLRQTSLNVENFIREDLASGIAVALQAGALSGSGSSNQPIGISTALTTTGGSNVIAMGTNGLAPTWASIVELQKQVAIANGDMGAIAYLFNAATRGKMKTVVRDAGSGLFLWADDGNVNGERTFVTNSVRSNLTKGSSSGVCSEAFFGNWNDLIIGSWGGLDIVVDPYSLSLSNQIQIGVNGYYDIAIQREASFAIIKDYLTT
jgi:HK97 family phage major capsid protein